MADIPELRHSENSAPALTATQEFGERDSMRVWEGQWVPRVNGEYTGGKAYFSARYIRDEYPDIVLYQDGEVYHE